MQAYLYRIAHNWSIDRYRNHEQASELSETIPSAIDLPEEQAAKRIRQRQIRLALRRLTHDQQMVISLKYLDERSNEEVAQVMKKPVTAVKALQHRALKSLQRLLEEKS